MNIAPNAAEIASRINGHRCRFLNTEFMYRPRPESGREQIIFDYALQSRLQQLGEQDTVVFVCQNRAAVDSLQPFEAAFPRLAMQAIITNPLPYSSKSEPTPERLGWEKPAQWQRMQTTDRWARIDMALEIASQIHTNGYLLMPAHDAVWGNGLLDRLVAFSQHHAKQGQPAAVSPYTYHQHSGVPGAAIPVETIHLINMIFSRDSLFRWKIRRDMVQAFWGKMSMTPFSMCQTIRSKMEMTLWEDDLDIDRIIREAGLGVRCQWISDPAVYRQALPVFDLAGVKTIIERTLHYSLHIPGEPVGGSHLTAPLGWLGEMRRVMSPRFRRYNAEAEQLIELCAQEIRERLRIYGASWVDWGHYRHVVRVGDPVVEVWAKG